MTRGPRNGSRRVLPAAGGGEEGGVSAGPAPPRSGTHDGGAANLAGPAPGRTCAPAARSAPPRPLRPLALSARRRERGGRSRTPLDWAAAGVGAEAGLHRCSEPVSSCLSPNVTYQPWFSASFRESSLCCPHMLTGQLALPHFPHWTSKHRLPDHLPAERQVT